MESQESQQRVSYLAFNINPAEGGNSSSFEGGTSFTRQQSHYSVVALFEKFRCRVIENESSRFVVVLKSKLFSDKSDLHVRLVAVTRLACRHKVRISETHDLHIAASATSRSRATNISMR
jgi:hypothetical protein